MAIVETLGIVGAGSVLKKILDDVYPKAKDVFFNNLTGQRNDIDDLKIVRALTSVVKIKTLWNIENEVSLYEFYYPSRVSFPQGIEKRVNSLKELGERSNIVIQGTAGQGKSIFLRYLCGQELNVATTSNRVPVFVELRRVRDDMGVHDLLLEALQKYKLPYTQEAWTYLAGSGKFVLLLDAFDEIDPSLASKSIYEIENIIDLYGDKLQIVVTSRPDAEIQKSHKFRVCKLMPLSDDDHLPFLQRICQEAEQAENLIKTLEGSTSDIRELLTTPLMMTLLVIVFKALHTIPDTVPKFYEELFDVLFYRHDNSKPGFKRKRFTQLDDSKIKDVFSAFCFYVRLHGLGVLTNAKFQELVKKASASTGLSVNSDGFKDELIKTLCLMQQDGFEYSFIHKSVVQYYAASFVRNSGGEFPQKFYQLAAKHGSDWDLELKFLAQIDSYNFNKYYEMPMLRGAAKEIGYSFEQYSEGAERRLSDYLSRNISMVFWHPGKIDGVTELLVGWSYSTDKSDPVLSILGGVWGGKIAANIEGNKDFYFAVAKHFSGDDEKKEYVPCFLIQDDIRQCIPGLPREVLDFLQEKYDSAMVIIKAEEGKAAMLADFI